MSGRVFVEELIKLLVRVVFIVVRVRFVRIHVLFVVCMACNGNEAAITRDVYVRGTGHAAVLHRATCAMGEEELLGEIVALEPMEKWEEDCVWCVSQGERGIYLGILARREGVDGGVRRCTGLEDG